MPWAMTETIQRLEAEVVRLRVECSRLAALAKSEYPCAVCGSAATVSDETPLGPLCAMCCPHPSEVALAWNVKQLADLKAAVASALRIFDEGVVIIDSGWDKPYISEDGMRMISILTEVVK